MNINMNAATKNGLNANEPVNKCIANQLISKVMVNT